MKLMSRLLCLCLCGLLLLSACGREQTAESRPESSAREVSSEEASVEESVSEASSVEKESSVEESSRDNKGKEQYPAHLSVLLFVSAVPNHLVR